MCGVDEERIGRFDQRIGSEEIGAHSVAFPAISTGIYGFPIERAAPIALRTARETTERLPAIELVRFVLFSDGDLRVFERALTELDG